MTALCSRDVLFHDSVSNWPSSDLQQAWMNESATHLAFVGLDVGVDDHVSLQRLLLDEALVAQVAPVRPDVGVNQNVPLHVGQQRELTAADTTLVLLHSLKDEEEQCLRNHD